MTSTAWCWAVPTAPSSGCSTWLSTSRLQRLRRPELWQREHLKQSVSGNNGALLLYAPKNKLWWGSYGGRTLVVSVWVCVCGVTESVLVSSGLNGSNCQLAWVTTTDLLQVMSSGAPEGVTECTGILLDSQKHLEELSVMSLNQNMKQMVKLLLFCHRAVP